MMAAAGDAYASFSWRRVGAAFLIALIYALAGPPIGAILVFPIATLAVAQFSYNDFPETAAAMFYALPLGLILSYVMAGALALLTGIATAVVAYQRGVVPIRMAAIGTDVRVRRLPHPAATLPREHSGRDDPSRGGQVGPALTLFVAVAASLVCWRLARPLQRRLA